MRAARSVAALLLLSAAAYAADPLVYAGTYGKGIYGFRLQSKTGKLTPLGIAAETSNPSFLLESPNHRVIYAVNENGDATQMGSVSAFAVDPQSGKLSLLNWVSSRGGAPCHLALDRAGRWLAVANDKGGSIAILPLLPDGKLGDAVWFSKPGGRVTAVAFSPDNRFLLTANFALDQILVYKFDAATGAIAPNDPPGVALKTGSGVGRLAFHPSGRALYAVNETSSTVTAFLYDSQSAKLSLLQTLPTIATFAPGNTAGAIVVNAAGSLLYVANRGHDSIYTFSIDPDRLMLSPEADFPTLGRTPRQFAIGDKGLFLIAANEDSNDLMVFKVHARTGQLTPAGKLTPNVPKPACVLIVGQ